MAVLKWGYWVGTLQFVLCHAESARRAVRRCCTTLELLFAFFLCFEGLRGVYSYACVALCTLVRVCFPFFRVIVIGLYVACAVSSDGSYGAWSATQG